MCDSTISKPCRIYYMHRNIEQLDNIMYARNTSIIIILFPGDDDDDSNDHR